MEFEDGDLAAAGRGHDAGLFAQSLKKVFFGVAFVFHTEVVVSLQYC